MFTISYTPYAPTALMKSSLDVRILCRRTMLIVSQLLRFGGGWHIGSGRETAHASVNYYVQVGNAVLVDVIVERQETHAAVNRPDRSLGCIGVRNTTRRSYGE